MVTSSVLEVFGQTEEVSNALYISKDSDLAKLMQEHFESWLIRREQVDPDSLPTPDMIKAYGYTAESHRVITKDGYINTLHRIPPKGKPGFKQCL